MKQNRYPVMFLTQGVTARYPPYADPRCHTIQTAVYHSSCHDLLVIRYCTFYSIIIQLVLRIYTSYNV